MRFQDLIVLANGGTTTASGTLIIQVEGSGSTPTIQIGSSTYNLDSASLASGNIKEYTLHIQSGQTITIAGCTLLNLWLTEGA